MEYSNQIILQGLPTTRRIRVFDYKGTRYEDIVLEEDSRLQVITLNGYLFIPNQKRELTQLEFKNGKFSQIKTKLKENPGYYLSSYNDYVYYIGGESSQILKIYRTLRE